MSTVEWRPPVLDIGVGDGHFAAIAYDQPIDVGIDPSALDLAEAKTRPGVYQQLMRASAVALPFRDGTFNTIVTNSVLEHIPDLDASLREIRRVLRPPSAGHAGGTLTFTTPSEHFPDFLLGSLLLRTVGGPRAGRWYGDFFNRISRHYHVHPPAVWREKLQRAGFDTQDIRYYFSARAHRRFDLSHYLGVPNLVCKRMLGRWVLFPAQMKPFERWLRPFYEEPLPETGAYLFIRCRTR